MRYVFPYDHPHERPLDEVKALVGGKAANLGVMKRELGLPVPPAFTVCTEACRAYLASGWPEGLDEELRAAMRRLEAVVGHRFGDPDDPLLVSVRSGAPVSMPGMMDTILNLGLTTATVAGLGRVAGNTDFSTDCHQRFLATYRDVVGVEAVPDDPWEQLRGAVEAVFRSWNSPRAQAYRTVEGIPDDLGTGVTVQAMVFGNRGWDSGTGVLFTRNPATGERLPYGDVMFDAQGEDVVAGTHQTQPISVLGERLPAVAGELREYGDRLERHLRDLCDIEFTIEQGRLWMLQVRAGKRSPQAALRIAMDMAEEPDFPLTREEAVRRVAHLLASPPTVAPERSGTAELLTTGLGASPGVVSGAIVVTPEASVEAADAGRDVILVRRETSPDDVHGMARAKGVLTASGGLASHAAVVARGWGIPAVVGASSVEVDEDGITIGGRRVAVGETITIDGGTGEVLAGSVAGTPVRMPEAETLLAWARELGIEIPRGDAEAGATVPAGAASVRTAVASAPAPAPSSSTPPAAAETSEEGLSERALRALLIKGFVLPHAVAGALAVAPEAAVQVLDRLVADGLVELSSGMFRLTEDGKEVARELIAADRARWGSDDAVAALDAFLALDHRVKEIVTAWQMRDVDGTQAFNDHSDAAYDAKVLGDLGALHRDARSWIDPLASGLPRLREYALRLDEAERLAHSGDVRYVASPRVDSYHTVWFELHEDLILLAGRSRAEEVAAGRA